ncbi:MAG TPA: hypothetical protein DHU96_17520, partial [Actinobacteria bacterium]|nr:hypothetical protein [Actinomycetota bacterium]
LQTAAELAGRMERRCEELRAAIAAFDQESETLRSGLAERETDIAKARAALAEADAEQERAREQRSAWQVEQAQVQARAQVAADRERRLGEESGAIDLTDTDAPTMYVGLSSSDAAASAGIMSCNVAQHVFGTNPCGVAGTPGWVAMGLFAWNSGFGLVDHAFPLTGISAGTGVKFSIYYNQLGNSLHYVITTNPTGTPITHSFIFSAHGAIFDHAGGLVDYSGCTTAPPPTVSDCGEFAVPGHAPLQDIRITQFFQGALTTANGQRGTFSGPWTLSPVKVTSQGSPPPGNQLQVEPSFLWNDNMGNGWGDAFGVWWRHNA